MNIIEEDNFDSDEERYMYAWLLKMKELGLVLKIKHHPMPFVLSSKQYGKHITTNKKGEVKEKPVFLLHDHSYEYDFKMLLNPIFEGIAFCTIDNYSSKLPIVANRRPNGSIVWTIDVKPDFERDHGSNTRFPLNQKWVMERWGVYVQKIIPLDSILNGKLVKAGFFHKTFTPDNYRFRPLKNGNGFLKVKCLNVKDAEYYYSTLQR